MIAGRQLEKLKEVIPVGPQCGKRMLTRSDVPNVNNFSPKLSRGMWANYFNSDACQIKLCIFESFSFSTH